MPRPWQLDVEDGYEGGVLEPGEVLEREEQLAILKQDPEAVLGDVADLNGRSACAKRLGCHPRAPVSTPQLYRVDGP